MSRIRTLTGQVLDMDALIERSKIVPGKASKTEIEPTSENDEPSKKVNGFVPPEPSAPFELTHISVKGGGSRKKVKSKTSDNDTDTNTSSEIDEEKENGDN